MRPCCAQRTAPARADFLALRQDASVQAPALVHAVLLTVQHWWEARPALPITLRLLMLDGQHAFISQRA